MCDSETCMEIENEKQKHAEEWNGIMHLRPYHIPTHTVLILIMEHAIFGILKICLQSWKDMG